MRTNTTQKITRQPTLRLHQRHIKRPPTRLRTSNCPSFRVRAYANRAATSTIWAKPTGYAKAVTRSATSCAYISIARPTVAKSIASSVSTRSRPLGLRGSRSTSGSLTKSSRTLRLKRACSWVAHNPSKFSESSAAMVVRSGSPRRYSRSRRLTVDRASDC